MRSEKKLRVYTASEAKGLDLKDAYYSIAVAENNQKYLKFVWKGRLFRVKSMPNGLSPAPCLFTKMLKPVLSHLRKAGHTIMGYIDDLLIQGDDVEQCKQNISDTISLLDSLGFTVHPRKSVLIPSHRITFWRFILDSTTMALAPTPKKASKTKAQCLALLSSSPQNISIRDMAHWLVSLWPWNPGCPMQHYITKC